MMRTYQSRPSLDAGASAQLDAFAALFGRAERSLFAQAARGLILDHLKPSFCAEWGLTSRQFNALSRSVKGKIQSLVEVRQRRIADLEDHLARLEQVLARLPKGSAKRHQKRRRQHRLQHLLDQLKRDQAEGVLRLCFGSRKLFHAQHHLDAHGYQDAAAWLQAWRAARSDEIFVLGSKDEKGGCQGCQLTPLADGRFRVRLRLPHALVDPAQPKATHLTFEVAFPYGREALAAALAAGIALSFRFLRDGKGWRLLASTEVQGTDALACRPGALGLDLNADHLALTLMDGAGNPIATRRIPLVTYGCSTEQASARIGEAVKQVIAWAKAAQVPVVIEKLDFQAKKRALKDQGVRYARMLSSLAYQRILQTVKARALDAGIPVREINPAFTSLIGRHKFAARYGLSAHGAAALVIARRSLALSERPNRSGFHGTSRAPARKRGEHVWKEWSRVSAGQRRMQRAPGRRTRGTPKGNPGKVILPATGAPPAHGAGGIQLGAAGGIPARESVPATVQGACFRAGDPALEFWNPGGLQ